MCLFQTIWKPLGAFLINKHAFYFLFLYSPVHFHHLPLPAIVCRAIRDPTARQSLSSRNTDLALPFKEGIIDQNCKALAFPVSSRPAVTVQLFCLEDRNRRTSKDSALKALQSVVCAGDKDKEEQVHESLAVY